MNPSVWPDPRRTACTGSWKATGYGSNVFWPLASLRPVLPHATRLLFVRRTNVAALPTVTSAASLIPEAATGVVLGLDVPLPSGPRPHDHTLPSLVTALARL